MRLKEFTTTEAVIDVALQGRQPMSTGSMGLMRSRADYGQTLQHATNPKKGAIDALTAELEVPVDSVESTVLKISNRFQIKQDDLVHLFMKMKRMKPEDYHHHALQKSKHEPMKV